VPGKALATLPIRFDDGFVDFARILLHPGEKGGSYIETNA
jgi:hypothetical protein